MISEWLFKTRQENCFNKLEFLPAVPTRSTMNTMLIILMDFYVWKENTATTLVSAMTEFA